MDVILVDWTIETSLCLVSMIEQRPALLCEWGVGEAESQVVVKDVKECVPLSALRPAHTAASVSHRLQHCCVARPEVGTSGRRREVVV